jgi:short-chain fatty acids transporter
MRRVGDALARFSTRWVPDAFVFAVLLTFLVYILGLIFTPSGPIQLIRDWAGGFWELLTFAMQMTLILVTGYALASSPPVRRGLVWLAARPKGGAGAVALTAVTAGILGWIHWGLGLIAGALLAREVAAAAKRRGIAVHFPLVAAAGYIGLLVWHSGLSGSAPLLVNTEGHFLEEEIGAVSLADTIFQPYNLVFVVIILIIAPLLLASMHPKQDSTVEIETTEELGGDGGGAGDGGRSRSAVAVEEETEVATAEQETEVAGVERAPAQRLAHSRILVGIIALAGLIFLVPFFADEGIVGLDLNVMNFTFLIAGLALHGTLANYARVVVDGAKASSGVIIQFPFYAGIMGIMASSGLVEVIADWFIAISTPLTYPFWAMTSAAAVNFAVPSGGGQWAVQGPIVIEATQQLGLSTGIGVMAVAMGDQLTNMIQPFWALPLLGITGLRAGQVLGYTAAVMIAAFAVAGLCITFLS